MPAQHPHKTAKRRPPDSKFKQQRLPVWQPVINFHTTWKYILIYGIVVFILGLVLMLLLNQQTSEMRVTYYGKGKHGGCEACIKAVNESRDCRKNCSSCNCPGCTINCQCQVSFEIAEPIQLPVFVYYEITGFFQNHRRYVTSRDDLQLLGKKENVRGCSKPFKTDTSGKYYLPCGAVANSWFTDKFERIMTNGSNSTPIVLNANDPDVLWSHDRGKKFRNPPELSNASICKNFLNTKEGKKFAEPRDWYKCIWDDWCEDGALENPRFINWMRPAPVSTFRKLYAIIKSGKGNCDKGASLCGGVYTMDINYRYNLHEANKKSPVEPGRKSVILATTMFWGTRKPFLAWFTLYFGGFCILLGIAFFFLDKYVKVKVHAVRRRSSVEEDKRVFRHFSHGLLPNVTSRLSANKAISPPASNQTVILKPSKHQHRPVHT